MTSISFSMNSAPVQNVIAVRPDAVLAFLRKASLVVAALFIPLLITFFIARSCGLSALCYEELSQQATTSAVCILPFGTYCIAMSMRRSFVAVVRATMCLSTVLGVILAAMI